MSLSFNGGKDCTYRAPRDTRRYSQVHTGTVLLHLVAASIGRRTSASSSSSPPKPLAAVYIPVPSPFPQLERFIDEAASAYNLDLFHCPPPDDPLPVESVPTPGAAAAPWLERARHVKGGEGMRLALEMYKERFPQVEAILIGTRRSDPHGGECTRRFPSLSVCVVLHRLFHGSWSPHGVSLAAWRCAQHEPCSMQGRQRLCLPVVRVVLVVASYVRARVCFASDHENAKGLRGPWRGDKLSDRAST